MSVRFASRLAWLLCLLSVALLVATVALLFMNSADTLGTGTWGTGRMAFVLPVVILAFTLVGALVSSRLPGNPIGWICLSIGLALMLASAADGYDVYALQTSPGSLPGGEYAAWLENWIWAPPVVLIGTFLVLLFPNGRLPSRRWRVVAWLSVAVVISFSVSEAFYPGRLAEAPMVTNPFGIEPARGVLKLLNNVSLLLLPVCFAASALSMIVRYRRSRGEERQQLKWFAAAAALLAAVFPFAIAVPYGAAEDLATLTFVGFPTAVGVAILRYRLYDIDILINRTLVYGSLTAVLALVYFGGVTATQAVVQALTGQERQSQLVVVASTLAIAALFNPLRRRVQAFVDRRFYRQRYDAAQTLEAFSAKLRDETDLDALSDELLKVARETMRPEQASLWLRDREARG